MTNTMYGIEYKLPKVYLLKESGIGVAEVAARTCYDSFESSENDSIKFFNQIINQKPKDLVLANSLKEVNQIESSELLETLAWVHHHHSIIEHVSLSYLVKGTSRGVLQEHARHRIQSISVRSTRYTMSGIINAYLAFVFGKNALAKDFYNMLDFLDFLVLEDRKLRELEYEAILWKLEYQRKQIGDEEFIKLTVPKSSLHFFTKDVHFSELFENLRKGKKKRNIGDPFKHIVTDNWKVDMVVTFNIRALKNYFDLRDSGAAWFQIQWLAKEIKKVTPKKYLKLIDKKTRVS